MKPQLRLRVLAALAAVLMTTPAPADLVYIDLGRAANATGTVEGVTYNDLSISGGPNTAGPVPIILNGAAATTAPAPLLTTGNTGSGWGIQLELLTTVSNGQWGNNGVSIAAPPYPEALSSIAPKALQDNLYMNRNHKGKITISGLDDAAQYTIIFYSNETNNSGNASMTFAPVKGSGAGFTVVPINAYKNETDLVEWIDVSPEDGQIATIKPVTATLPASADWTTLGPFDLSAADNTNIYLEFRYDGTDANFIGLYIDNVEVTQAP